MSWPPRNRSFTTGSDINVSLEHIGEIDGQAVNSLIPINGFVNWRAVLMPRGLTSSRVSKPVMWASEWDDTRICICSVPRETTMESCEDTQTMYTCSPRAGDNNQC